MAEPVDFIQDGGSSWSVEVDGETVSHHATQRKALAVALVQKVTHPTRSVWAVQRSLVRPSVNRDLLAGLLGVTSEPEPEPTPEPEPDPEPEPEPEPTPEPEPEPAPDPEPEPTPDPEPTPAPSGSYGPLTFGGGRSGDPGLIPDGYPTGETTGLAGVGLDWGDVTQESSGKITQKWLDANNGGSKIIEGRRFNAVQVHVGGVTFRRCLILQPEGHGWYYALDTSRVSGTVVEDGEIVGKPDASAAVLIDEGVLRRCNVYGGEDGVKYRSNVTIEDSYVHDQDRPEGAHCDASQTEGGHDTAVVGSTLMGPWRESTSAMIHKTRVAPLERHRVVGNFLSGGTYTLYMLVDNHPVTDVEVTDNLWLADSWKYGAVSGSGGVWSGNRDTEGRPVEVG